MSKWIKYTGAFIPLLGAWITWPVVNVVILPTLGGLIYGLFSSSRRDIYKAPLAALLPLILVFLYYVAIDYMRFIRLVEIAPIIPILLATFWIAFFSLGATAGYLIYRRGVLYT